MIRFYEWRFFAMKHTESIFIQTFIPSLLLLLPFRDSFFFFFFLYSRLCSVHYYCCVHCAYTYKTTQVCWIRFVNKCSHVFEWRVQSHRAHSIVCSERKYCGEFDAMTAPWQQTHTLTHWHHESIRIDMLQVWAIHEKNSNCASRAIRWNRIERRFLLVENVVCSDTALSPMSRIN